MRRQILFVLFEFKLLQLSFCMKIMIDILVNPMVIFGFFTDKKKCSFEVTIKQINFKSKTVFGNIQVKFKENSVF